MNQPLQKYLVTGVQLQQFRAALEQDGSCTLAGTMQSGTLDVSTIAGKVQLVYEYQEVTARPGMLTVSIASKPRIIRDGMIWERVGRHILDAGGTVRP